MKKTIIKKFAGMATTTVLIVASISSAFAYEVTVENNVPLEADNSIVNIVVKLDEPTVIDSIPYDPRRYSCGGMGEMFPLKPVIDPDPFPIYIPKEDNVSTNSQKDDGKTYSESELKYILEVVRLTNAEREKNGIAPLRINYSLCKAAQKHAEDMAKNNYLSHTSKDGRTMSDRIEEYTKNYFCIGENIAARQESPEDVVKSWMNSSEHKTNILNEKYTEIGVGYSNNYWVQDFLG